MSFTLSLAPQSHVFNNYPYERPNALRSSSTETVKQYGSRQVSSGSLPSGSVSRLDWLKVAHENVCGPRASRSSVQLSELPTRPPLRKTHSQVSPKFRWTQNVDSPASLSTASFHSILLDRETEVNPFSGECVSESLTAIPAATVNTEATVTPPGLGPRYTTNVEPATVASQHFKRWLCTLRRSYKPHDLRTPTYHRLPSEPYEENDENTQPYQTAIKAARKRNSTSHASSNGYVSAVRSATLTVAETSIAPRSWAEGHFGHLRKFGTTRSTRTSQDTNPGNMEYAVDDQAWARAVQRRKILEELIESEESYVADLKILVNVYFTLLTSVCALSINTRTAVRENVIEILQMHENLLGELYETVPYSEYSQSHAKDPPTFYTKRHIRWHSDDSTPSRPKMSRIAQKLRHSLDIAKPARQIPVGSAADTKTTAAVAHIFERFVGQLFAYEEYGAKYEMMVRDLASTYKTLSSGQAFEKGIEILSRTLESINARDGSTQKGMTFADLVIKPIQRVCKYPLLFADLCKHTPVTDDPEAHSELEKILYRLKEATREINKATDDPRTSQLIEKTWLLQDRMIFPSQASKSLIARMLGHIELCGALHVAYETKSGVKGQYMLCVLFKSCVVLAVGEKGLSSFHVVASVPLVNVSIEEADNGKGLQCHTAPFSWKIVFEKDHRWFEILLSASSPLEESEWRKSLNERSCVDGLEPSANQVGTRDVCSLLTLDLKSIGPLYGQPPALFRGISMQRAATVCPKSQLSQVIIRNTCSAYQMGHSASDVSLPLNRSLSLLSSGSIPVLAPRRSERINLELALSDVWTKELLPYPGMRQSENPFKASANHVMRKLSMASITSTISKRTSSFVNFNKPEPRVPMTAEVGQHVGRSHTPNPRSDRALSRPIPSRTLTSPPLKTIDFHSTPEMFLPPDFELKYPRIPKPSNSKITIRAVSDENASSAKPRSAQITANVSPSKLRQSATAHITPVTQIEVVKPGTSALNLKSMESTKNADNIRESTIPKENFPATMKPFKPISKQLRRFFN